MKKLHIANLYFEMLFETEQKLTLDQALLLHPNLLQLQYLPRLYTDDPFYTIGQTFNEPCLIEPWGHCPLIQAWANKEGHIYHMPNASLLKRVASKRFTFEHCPQLPEAKLITHANDLMFKHFPVVLKTEYGFSGRGMRIYHAPFTIDAFIERELKAGRVLIAEPWVKTHLNFSTQYFITESAICKLGSTLLLNNAKGGYRGTLTGCDQQLQALTPHFVEGKALCQKLQTMGYFGHVGIDGFIWDQGIHPVVEMNPRKTMGYVALQYANHRPMTFLWGKNKKSATKLLPDEIVYKNKHYHFELNFYARTRQFAF